MKDTQVMGAKRLVTVKDLPSTPGYEWLTQPALRHLIFKATPRMSSKGYVHETNGLVELGAILRIGRKVLVDLDRFDEWIERHRQG